MSFITRISAGVRALFNRRGVNRDLDDEVADYIERAAAANRASGMSDAEALRTARMSVGSVASVKEPARAFGWDVALGTLGQDVRYAIRHLAKAPGFTIAASLSLALGIGANTAIFSMIDAMLIRRLPVERSEEVVHMSSPGSVVFSYPALDDVRRAQTSFTGLAGFAPITVSVNDADATDLVTGYIVTGNYFDVLGVKPARGRLLSDNDDRTPGAHPVAVISTPLWKSRFGGRADVVGAEVRLNGQPYTVIGVTPAGFNGTQTGTPRDVYVPMMQQAWMRPPRAGYSGEMNPDLLKVRANNWIFAVGRLKPGVSVQQATAAVNAITRSMTDWPIRAPATEIPSVSIARVDDGPPGERAQIVNVARLLSAVVFAVLLIACANVANLLLARATSRRKEIAVRLAIGATRTRLVRQLLTESVILATLGGAIGLGLAWVSIRAVRASPPPPGALPVTLNFALDLPVLAFTFALAVGTGIVFGLIPALRASRPDLVPALKDQSGTAATRRRRFTPRNGLVVAQVALSLVLLISSGLFLRSLERTRSLSPGFDVDRLMTVPLNIQLLRYTRDQGKTFYRQVVERIEAIPGVASASIVRWVPLGGGGSSGSLHLEGRGGADNVFQSQGGGFDLSNPATISNDVVGLNYFRTMGIALKKGRDFTDSDNEGSTPVVVVNESFVKRHYGNEEPIGKRISMRGPSGPWIEIIGVVADSKYATLDERPTRIIYLPSAQNHVNGMTLVVRAQGDPSTIMAAVGREVHALDRSLPMAGTRTLKEWVGISIYAARAGAALITGFGLLALLLSAIGLYGVLAYAVSRRTREFGLRMALGARSRDVLTQVLGEGVGLVAVGGVVGLGVALSLSHLLARFLYGVSTNDLPTFVGTPVLLLAVGVVACLVPARRATKVDPIRALKEE
jgi:predicted permease